MSAHIAKSAAVKAHRERNATAAAPRKLGAWCRNANGSLTVKRRSVDADMENEAASYAKLRSDAGLSPRTIGDDGDEDENPAECHGEDEGDEVQEAQLLPEMEALILATNVKSPANMSASWRRFLNDLHATLHAAGLCV